MNFKIILLTVIIFNLTFLKVSFAQFNNPLGTIFNEVGKGIDNVIKSLGESIQKTDEKSKEENSENKEKKEYNPQCDNPKMAELLKQNVTEKNTSNESSQFKKESSSTLKRPIKLPKEITNEEWNNITKKALETNSEFVSISKNFSTNKFFFGLDNNLHKANGKSLDQCTKDGKTESCGIIFGSSIFDRNIDNTNAALQTNKPQRNLGQTYSKDPLINKFFESYNLYAQATALLLEAYGKDQEAEIIRQSIVDSKNPNKSDQEKFANTLVVVTEKGNNLKDLIYCRTEPLSAGSKKKYEEAIPITINAVITSFELTVIADKTATNFQRGIQADPLSAVLKTAEYISYTPQVIEYLGSIGKTFSFILTGAKANNIKGSEKLQSVLKDL